MRSFDHKYFELGIVGPAARHWRFSFPGLLTIIGIMGDRLHSKLLNLIILILVLRKNRLINVHFYPSSI